MVKTYITLIPLQSEENLQQVLYEAKGFEIKNNFKTRFPIVPIIADDHEEGYEVRVLAVRTDNTNTRKNYAVFLRELEPLGIREDQVQEIVWEEDQSEKVMHKLLLRILDEIPDDSLIRADITFGTKPMSLIMLYALNFIEKLKDTEVQGIYYGEIRRDGVKTVGSSLYNLTSFKVLGKMVDMIDKLEARNPQEVLHRLLDL